MNKLTLQKITKEVPVFPQECKAGSESSLLAACFRIHARALRRAGRDVDAIGGQIPERPG